MTRGNERLQSSVSVINCVLERTEWRNPQQLFGLMNFGEYKLGQLRQVHIRETIRKFHMFFIKNVGKSVSSLQTFFM